VTPPTQRAAVRVVAVTYNSATTIGSLLDSLEREQAAISHLVIVDNGSSDTTVALTKAKLSRFRVPTSLIEQENVGFARGVNAGVRQSLGDGPVLCVNPDVVLAPGTLTGLLDVYGRVERAGIVTAPLQGLDGQRDSASIRSLPRLGGSAVYAALGRFTPRRLKYNDPLHSAMRLEASDADHVAIEATTGALMLVSPSLIKAGRIFDERYWMYGEDLQLCHDCRSQGMEVVMAKLEPSRHLKGVSSGRPRKLRSDFAFHEAMWVYYKANLSRGREFDIIVLIAIAVRFIMSRAAALVQRGVRRPAVLAAPPAGKAVSRA
jgi:N-acetylglucosaminyl-diphospho-decaprenol L-rhamnosyltransferase